jgi:hypothetical protein
MLEWFQAKKKLLQVGQKSLFDEIRPLLNNKDTFSLFVGSLDVTAWQGKARKHKFRGELTTHQTIPPR